MNRGKRALDATCRALFAGPAFALCCSALAVGALAHRVFFLLAPWLWARQAPLDLSTINPWVRGQVEDPDGAEPFALLVLVTLAAAIVSALAHGLALASIRVRAVVAGFGLVGGILLLNDAHFVLPVTDVSASLPVVCLFVLSAIAASVVIGWKQAHGRSLSVGTALFLVAIVLIPSGGMSPGDAGTILAPALRLLNGAAPAGVYMQYDYLPSLLMEGWLWLGGAPAGIFFLTGIGYFALLVALFVLARRWFAHPGLAGPFLVSLLIVRISAGVSEDVTALPQVSPIRLDLWIVPVALALRFGLRHWAVALALGLLCIFSRSIGVLYVGGYGMALAGDFLAVHLGGPRGAFSRALAHFSRRLAPQLLILLACFGITALVFGSPISDAALLYRKLGIGQMRIAFDSFYWWLIPLNALTAALAFWQRAALGEQRGGALFLLAALTISSSIYFFGRSHENNLVNLSACYLTCYFVSLDLLLLQVRPGVPASRSLQIGLSSLLIGLCAWRYSGKLWAREVAQLAAVSRVDLTPPIAQGHALPPMHCPEIIRAVPNLKVYFLSINDFWFYSECGLAPAGYMQPMALEALKSRSLQEMNDLLDQGYTVAMRKSEGFVQQVSPEFVRELTAASPSLTFDSAHYRYVKRK